MRRLFPRAKGPRRLLLGETSKGEIRAELRRELSRKLRT